MYQDHDSTKIYVMKCKNVIIIISLIIGAE